MKIVKETGKNIFRFTCRQCGVVLESYGNELELIKPGVIQYTCPKCGETKIIRELNLKVIKEFKEIDPLDEEVEELLGRKKEL